MSEEQKEKQYLISESLANTAIRVLGETKVSTYQALSINPNLPMMMAGLQEHVEEEKEEEPKKEE